MFPLRGELIRNCDEFSYISMKAIGILTVVIQGRFAIEGQDNGG